MSILQADPTFQDELGNGLIRRWAIPDDTEGVARIMGTVWRRSADDPLNPRVMDAMRRNLRGDHPLMHAGDCVVIEDTRKPQDRIVACTCLWHHTWTYEGIPFGVGRPENVATDPDYRNRGLVRAMFELAHARSAAHGHLVQAITGIPYFYRQFDYEYALDLQGRRVTYLSLIPQPSGSEPYKLRPVTTDDIPVLERLANRRRATSMVWCVVPEGYWRYQIEQWQEPAVLGQDATSLGISERVVMIVDAQDAVQGYVFVTTRRYGSDMQVYAVETAAGVNVQALMPSLLRALQTYGYTVPAIRPDTAPFVEISFYLGRTHPVYDALGPALAPFGEPPYAWYVRVPDVSRFIRQITPVLERRLAQSAVASYTGELRIDWYRGGLHLKFAEGRLLLAAPWSAPFYNNNADAGCPPLVFLQLLFGHRSLEALRAIFPDVWANDGAELLLDTLFPARPSSVAPL